MPSSSKLRMFMETTSLRGFGKVVRSQTSFLRFLWLFFVLLTTSLLCYSIYKIVNEYLLFDVNIQTKREIDDPTAFPSVTLCNNQQFSMKAYDLWRNNTVLSPTAFNRILRTRSLEILNSMSMEEYLKLAHLSFRASKEQLRPGDDPSLVKPFIDTNVQALLYSYLYDNSRLYYQSMEVEQAISLGHRRDDTIVDCVIRQGQLSILGTRGCRDKSVKVTTFSHPNYFNCFTLEFTPEYSDSMDSLTLIAWLGPPENYDIKYRQAFLFDVFEQAYGLRVMIHEPGSFPKILEDSIQIEPGKMNEILYQQVRFLKKNTPINPCLSDQEVKDKNFADLDLKYSYDLELCLNSMVQEEYKNRCGCLYVTLPRIVMPTTTDTKGSIPYCGLIDDKIEERSTCAKNINARLLRQKFEKVCLPRCRDTSYEHQLSVTKWRTTQWQLFWMSELGSRWNELLAFAGENYTDAVLQQKLNAVRGYLTAENVTDISKFSTSNSKETIKFDDRYTFVVIKRKSNNTMVKIEKIVLTPNALFSRLGGLGSIYIGLTLAFFVELIEFIYNVAFSSHTKPSGGDKAASSAQPEQTNDKMEMSAVKEIDDNGVVEKHLLLPNNHQHLLNKLNHRQLGSNQDMDDSNISQQKNSGQGGHNSDQIWVPR